MRDIVPNTTPHKGAVAIFEYHDKLTGKLVKHIGIEIDVGQTGFSMDESNFTKCTYDRRFIDWNDPHLIGFWSSGLDGP